MPDVILGAAQEYIEGVYGGPTEEIDALVTIGTTPTKLIGNDPDRLALAFVNVGTASVYFLFSNTVSTTNGIILQSGGGLFSVDVRNDQTLPTREWWAVVAAGTVDVVTISTRRFNVSYPLSPEAVKQRVAQSPGSIEPVYIPSTEQIKLPPMPGKNS